MRITRLFFKAIGWFLTSVALAVVYYLVITLFFDNDEQRRIKQENEVYEQSYPRMQASLQLLKDQIDSLERKDDGIYHEIFHTDAPSMMQDGPAKELTDSIPERKIYSFIAGKTEIAAGKADRIEDNFRAIFDKFCEDGFIMPPMSVPLSDFSVARTGASIGEKMSPFYNIPIRHNGLDILAPIGSPVISPAKGIVSRVERSRNGQGNNVEIDHGNGYITRYNHLREINADVGMSVRKGTRIGSVGLSGNSLIPHLHYEIIRDSIAVNPLYHLFGSLTPQEYSYMLTISAKCGQSMD